MAPFGSLHCRPVSTGEGMEVYKRVGSKKWLGHRRGSSLEDIFKKEHIFVRLPTSVAQTIFCRGMNEPFLFLGFHGIIFLARLGLKHSFNMANPKTKGSWNEDCKIETFLSKKFSCYIYF